MPIFIWDASDYDWDRGEMDVAAARRDDIVGFTHKATEGTRTQHIHYGEAMARARAAGMPVMGAYMVPRTPGSYGHGTIAQQVAYFLAYLDAQTPWWRSMPEFFIQVDTEHWGYDDVAPQYGALAAGLLRAQTGKFVIHYAPRWAYGDTIPGNEPLWASSYGTNPVVPYRQAYPGDQSSGWAPYSGRVPTFLQYGSKLQIGSQPGCDANAFRGTVEQLRALVTGGQTMAEMVGIEPLGTYLMRVERALWWPIPGIAKDVAALKTALAQVLTAQGAAQADIDALLARPAATLTVTPDTVQPLIDALNAALIAHPDVPISEANQAILTSVLGKFFSSHFPPASAPAAG